VGKRFTDINIWFDKPWFIELTPDEKCAFMFIKDRCDNVGVWVPNFKIAETIIGAPINWDLLIQKVNGNIIILENGKWWMPDFCDFQYGKLKENCIPHKSYIVLLKKYGLFERVIKGYSKGMNTLQEKEKELEKELEKEKDKRGKKEEKHKYGEYSHVLLTDTEYQKIQTKTGNADKWIKILDEGIELKGYKYKSHYLAVLKWYKKDEPVSPKKKIYPVCAACGVSMQNPIRNNVRECYGCGEKHEWKVLMMKMKELNV